MGESGGWKRCGRMGMKCLVGCWGKRVVALRVVVPSVLRRSGIMVGGHSNVGHGDVACFTGCLNGVLSGSGGTRRGAPI